MSLDPTYLFMGLSSGFGHSWCKWFQHFFIVHKIWEKTVTSNTSISNIENFNLENESGELSRELKDGNTQYRFQQFFLN